MKKTIAIIVLLGFFLNGYSQNFKLGVKFGTSINKISGQSFKDGFTFGYHVGAFSEIKLSNKFFLQPEVYFSEINVDSSSRFDDVYSDLGKKIQGIKLEYLNIPILLNYKVGKLMVLQLGPQYGILLNKNSALIYNGEQAFKTGEFSMVGGLQFKIANLRIYGRYVIGLQNINNIDNQETWKNESIQLGIGLSIL